jgi:hypothetical protein
MTRHRHAILILFLAATTLAQKPKPTPTPPTPAPAAPAPAAAQKPAPTPPDHPIMTEVQQANLDRDLAKIDAANSRAAAESASWVADADAIIQAVQNANPEFIWHEASGQGGDQRSGWVHKPPQPQPAAPQPAAPAPAPPAPQPK